MSEGGAGDGGRRDVERRVVHRAAGLRRLAEQVAQRLGGHPAVVRLRAVMETYDRAGGGLVASGLAYTSLLALLPGLLLVLSVVGFLIRAPGVEEQIAAAVAAALPPLQELAKVALAGVSSNAVPSGILAIITLLWGSSRFYANLDTALSRIFLGAPRRNPVAQTVRGLALTATLILVPVGLITVDSLVQWVDRLAPGGVRVGEVLKVVLDVASPLGSLLAFCLAVALCYRLVPSRQVPWRSLRVPAVSIGVILAAFTQVYVYVAPRLIGLWAVHGTALALIGLLAWLSIAFNALLLGAAWTEVRAGVGPEGPATPRGGLPAAARRAGEMPPADHAGPGA